MEDFSNDSFNLSNNTALPINILSSQNYSDLLNGNHDSDENEIQSNDYGSNQNFSLNQNKIPNHELINHSR